MIEQFYSMKSDGSGTATVSYGFGMQPGTWNMAAVVVVGPDRGKIISSLDHDVGVIATVDLYAASPALSLVSLGTLTIPADHADTDPEPGYYVLTLAESNTPNPSSTGKTVEFLLVEPAMERDLSFTPLYPEQYFPPFYLIGATASEVDSSGFNRTGVSLAELSDLPSVPAIGSTVTDETTWGISIGAGSSGDVSDADHTHGSPADPRSQAHDFELLMSCEIDFFSPAYYNAGGMFGGVVYNGGGALGDYMGWIREWMPGTWDFELCYEGDTGGGAIASLTMDGVEFGTIDTSASAGAHLISRVTGATVAEGASEFDIVSKTGGAGNYLSLRHAKAWRTGA